METAKDCTVYIDEVFEYDETNRKRIHAKTCVDGEFLTGSVVEGAFICRGVMEAKQNLETDLMKPFGEIPSNRSEQILVPTDQLGYYRIRFNEDLLSCIDEKYLGLLEMNDVRFTEYLDDTFHKMLLKQVQADSTYEFHTTQYKDGAPNLYGDVNMGFIQLESDTVLCIKLSFWPEIVHPWFKRKRNWPCPEIINEIILNKCHLVLKASTEGGSNDQWRLSFSKAECILSKGKTVFQKKCYLLAKFMYYANLKEHIDEETGRHISSYLLKTTMLHLLEQTNPEEWRKWETGKCYIEVVHVLFQRLAQSLNVGFLPFFFVEEMNLLVGYSEAFLKKMSYRIQTLCEEWKGAEGEELFHASIKSMYNYIATKMESPNIQWEAMDFLTTKLPNTTIGMNDININQEVIDRVMNSVQSGEMMNMMDTVLNQTSLTESHRAGMKELGRLIPVTDGPHTQIGDIVGDQIMQNLSDQMKIDQQMYNDLLTKADQWSHNLTNQMEDNLRNPLQPIIASMHQNQSELMKQLGIDSLDQNSSNQSSNASINMFTNFDVGNFELPADFPSFGHLSRNESQTDPNKTATNKKCTRRCVLM